MTDEKRAIRTSEAIGAIAAALLAAKSEFPTITKNRTANIPTSGGKAYSYNYADLGVVLDAVQEPLARNGLVAIQPLGTIDSGGAVVTLLMHTSGEWIESTFPVATYPKAQETGSAITYIRRYAMVAALGIATEEDDDGAAAQNAGKPKAKKAEKPRPQPEPEQRQPAPVDEAAIALRLEIQKAVQDGNITADQAQEAAVKHGVGTAALLNRASADVLRSMIETLGLNEKETANV